MNESLTWSLTLLSSLYDSGVRHAVISPGSRSTPLTLAASIHPGIQKKVVLDERSAAFIALGIGKSTGFPAVLICTSGTAVTNYYPAVIEAKESGVPLIVLSADRPPNLRNLGSSQTIDQLKIFGNQTVFFHEAGEPSGEKSDLKRIAYAGKQAIDFSIDRGGAAHINLAFRKPLEPDVDFFNQEKERLSKFSFDTEPERFSNACEITPNQKILDFIEASGKPLIIAGPANPAHALTQQIDSISNHLNAPVLAEPGSQVSNEQKNRINHFDLFTRDREIRKSLQPDLILRFGDQPFSSSLLWMLEEWNDIPVIHLSARKSPQDHAISVSHTIYCQKIDSINLDRIQPKTEIDWLEKWRRYQQKAGSILQRRVRKTDSLTDGHIFSYFSEQLLNDWNVMLSNSLPARDMLTFGHVHPNQFVNRGAAGIDGILSTAIGIHFSSNIPTCCLIGDLAFLHDSNALYTLQQVEDRPFVVIVVNNQGGNIFKMLPVYRNEKKAAPGEIFQSYFETPQKTDISHLAKASGIHYQKIDSLSSLNKVKLDEFEEATIIECVTDRQASMNLRIGLLTS
ncbi:2-succinyl-5-enolpyruvyl-6-hydroxy-3-cyclohexene-1-carboxylic-acid synthase [Rhodohalobacter sp. 614A]|uniref:2-succinyl-5-enolpyruvyl-6-hydroxy-3- cyclohexene-1-carboxylic-acid synthase n=1 Tax=Rhodohalobacter sp. 614A TaxID=2908649 RepID=UPI001F43027F|nr:2-succinyl-5-enolpyruvyl-6-hydroxy-3-cyclohexene-1-carboxylic-acid synthase [Rhodohalobacter sp. 614A]